MSLLEKLKEEVITDLLLQKQYETEKEIYNIAKCLKKIRKEKNNLKIKYHQTIYIIILPKTYCIN